MYMYQIKLDVNEENIETVMGILKNLKEGLIHNIDMNESVSSTHTKYQPKHNKVIYENERPQGKYLSPNAYKSRLQSK